MRLAKFFCAILAWLLWLPLAAATEIDWSGIKWQVRTGGGKPCATGLWSEENVWVDGNGWLHLKIGKLPSGEFSCAEITSVQRFGFGAYEFEVQGPIGAVDDNVVFGMFMYPPRDVGPDGTNELDIEIARWGRPDAPQVNYTAWPRSHKGSNRTTKVRVPTGLTDARFRMIWQPEQVRWESSLPGARPVSFEGDIADQPQMLKINLWLFKNSPTIQQSPAEFKLKYIKKS